MPQREGMNWLLAPLVALVVSQETVPPRKVHFEQPDLSQKTPGRFVIVNPNAPSLARTTLMLDTATGRCWMLVADAQGRSLWEETERWSF